MEGPDAGGATSARGFVATSDLMPTRTYLEQNTPGDLRPVPPPGEDVIVVRVDECAPSFWRRLYTEVGEAYQWVDRLVWTDSDINAYLSDPDVSLWVLSVGGEVAGYFELRKHPQDTVEIAYFGLLPAYVGRGLGKYLLSEAAARAWELQPARVWLHTSTLDHEAALPNYLARGFSIVRVEQY
jgi:GNAT superfamily N-acetyltransferase